MGQGSRTLDVKGMGPGTSGARPVIVRDETNGIICLPAGSPRATGGSVRLVSPLVAGDHSQRSANLRSVRFAIWLERLATVAMCVGLWWAYLRQVPTAIPEQDLLGAVI